MLMFLTFAERHCTPSSGAAVGCINRRSGIMGRGNGRQYRGRPKEQLYDNISKNPVTGCWNWIGGLFPKSGYGQFNNREIHNKPTTAHRASWIIHKGQIPNGLMVLHDCDNRKCVNPDHLHLGDNQTNMIERSKRGYVHQRRLDEAKVREMRQLRQQGWGWMKLARRYGVAQTSVISATVGESWAWVDEPIPTYIGESGRNTSQKPEPSDHNIRISQDNRSGRFYVIRWLEDKKKIGLGGFSSLEAAQDRVRECVADIDAGREHTTLPADRRCPDVELMRSLRSEGLTFIEIAERTGFSEATTYNLTRDIDADTKLRGSSNPSSRYTEEQVSEFKALRRSGISITEAARQCKIGRSMAYQIDDGHRWGHIE
jgi:HNH endonuclease